MSGHASSISVLLLCRGVGFHSWPRKPRNNPSFPPPCSPFLLRRRHNWKYRSCSSNSHRAFIVHRIAKGMDFSLVLLTLRSVCAWEKGWHREHNLPFYSSATCAYCMRPTSFLSAFIEKDHMQEIANTGSIVLCDPPKSVKGCKIFIAKPTHLDQQRPAKLPPLFTVCWMDADQIISPSLTCGKRRRSCSVNFIVCDREKSYQVPSYCHMGPKDLVAGGLGCDT